MPFFENIEMTLESEKHEPRIKFFHKLYSCQPMLNFAKRLRESNPERYGGVLQISAAEFADGNQRIALPFPNCDGENLIYICSYYHNDEKKLLDQRIMQVLSERGARHLTVIVPFFGSATNERVETGVEVCKGQSIPYETVAVAALDSKAFSSLGNGNTRVRVLLYDLHTLAQRFYFPPSVSVVMASTLPYALQQLAAEIDVVVTPDDGALKRFKEYFTHLPSTYFYKERTSADERMLVAAEPSKINNNKRILIVDDLVRSGGTIGECALRCREYGASAVSAFVAHAVFPNHEELNFLQNGKYGGSVDRFYITDTLPHVAARLESVARFTVFNFADIVSFSDCI